MSNQEELEGRDNQAEKAAAKAFHAHLREGDTDAFIKLENDLLAESEQRWGSFVTAFRTLRSFDELAAEAGLEEKYRPKVWWMRSPYPGNFGDILTPYVLWHAFGVMPRWVASSKAEGLCIGSIAKFARPGTRVWGTGMPRDSDPLCPTAIYSAVRGPLSRAAVIASGGECPEIYGDAAVLLPELYAPNVPKTHKIGIIPHVLQEGMFRAAIEKLDADHIKIISLLSVTFDEIEGVIRDIMSCDEIVSTSLHGLIVSHAYGVPCQSLNVTSDTESAEDSFKMRDYKLSVGLDDPALGVPPRFTDLGWLEARKCVLPPSPIDTKALRAAFPFPVRLNS
ncbi:polysaccharide pyruvyl transferase family protein [Methylobacterium sp. E-045]|uniref:polysaccharide pyruvyl transferase family protein n=1 Tax=Methylobacterium sp. E-045 TaxID=2836575 RepID=UPI001FBA483B|nr:polysaccharide pyruvyl transferase family protein [Methylobacterium sp. E-045]MCJ2128072.1 polysaccharide pyruvyl transferase family protein [Methylobacterium sp. E-045]